MKDLLYLAWQFWSAEQDDIRIIATTRKDLSAALISGLALALGNPKTIAFYLALLPLVLDLHSISVNNWALVLVPATVLQLLLVGTVYIQGALAVRRTLAVAKAQTRLHCSAAVAMAGAAGIMILREW